MLEATERILREHDALGKVRLDDGDLRYYGLLRLLEIIGEAAYKLTREFRAAHQEVPWAQIIGMRHIVVHEYDAVNTDTVWNVIEHNLPTLRQQLQTIIDSLPE